MIISFKPEDTDKVKVYLDNCRSRFIDLPYKFFKFDWAFHKGYFFIDWENVLPPFYYLGIVTSLIGAYLDYIGASDWLVKLCAVAGVLLTLTAWFWSKHFIKLIIKIGLKKSGVKDKVKFLKIDEAITGALF